MAIGKQLAKLLSKAKPRKKPNVVGSYITQIPASERKLRNKVTEDMGIEKGVIMLHRSAAALEKHVEYSKVRRLAEKTAKETEPAFHGLSTDEEIAARKQGNKYFEDFIVNEPALANNNTPSKLIYLHPSDFLKMAMPGFDKYKQKDVNNLIKRGVPFNEPIELFVRSNQKGILTVFSHEGRHRARALLKEGVTRMPVKLVVSSDTAPGWTWNRVGQADMHPAEWPSFIRGEDNGYDWKRGHEMKFIPFNEPNVLDPVAQAKGSKQKLTDAYRHHIPSEQYFQDQLEYERNFNKHGVKGKTKLGDYLEDYE